MQLSEHLIPFAYDTAYWLTAIYEDECTIEELSDLSLEVSGKLRALAIMMLLVEGDVDRFHHNLTRSGLVRARFLEHCTRDGALVYHQASGRFDGIVDSIASGHFEMARRIAAASPTTWLPDQEYEEDYCYAQLLHLLVQPNLVLGEADQLLARFAEATEDVMEPRLELCEALIRGAQAQFDQAFTLLLDARETQIEKNKARGQLVEPAIAAERSVFIEGLAILQLATARGMVTRSEYPFCPSMARQNASTDFPGD